MRALDVAELRIVLIIAGILAFVGLGLGLFIIWNRHIESYAFSRAAGAAGFLAGGGLGWLIGMAIVMIRRRG
jgi:L-asparagine transporter-like permease